MKQQPYTNETDRPARDFPQIVRVTLDHDAAIIWTQIKKGQAPDLKVQDQALFTHALAFR